MGFTEYQATSRLYLYLMLTACSKVVRYLLKSLQQQEVEYQLHYKKFSLSLASLQPDSNSFHQFSKKEDFLDCKPSIFHLLNQNYFHFPQKLFGSNQSIDLALPGHVCSCYCLPLSAHLKSYFRFLRRQISSVLTLDQTLSKSYRQRAISFKKHPRIIFCDIAHIDQLRYCVEVLDTLLVHFLFEPFRVNLQEHFLLNSWLLRFRKAFSSPQLIAIA